MATVYVREQGAVVRKKGERIVVTKDGREIMDIPLIHLDQLAIIGNVQLTTPAVALLLQNEVDVVFFSEVFFEHPDVALGPINDEEGISACHPCSLCSYQPCLCEDVF
ncbi:MAG TPA: hypothetical protein ENG33_00880, partial [Chloroflexi bacterium]|nr:hypothetical protein [Chloroflexota bacterium]